MNMKVAPTRSAWTLTYCLHRDEEGKPRTHLFSADSEDEALKIASRELKSLFDSHNPVLIRQVSLAEWMRERDDGPKIFLVPEIRAKCAISSRTIRRSAVAA